MIQNDFNVWCKWHPLKKMMIGSCVNANYFEHVGNKEIKDKLTQILVETQEDLDNFEKVLVENNVEVMRPFQDQTLRLNPDRKQKQITPSMTPRDWFVVIGNDLLQIYRDDVAFADFFNENYVKNSPIETPNKSFLKMLDENNFENSELVPPPCWTLVGKDLFLDSQMDGVPIKPDVKQCLIDWLKRAYPDLNIHWLTIGGHNDGCFHTCKPGAIVSLNEIQIYEETFPGWDVLYLPDQSWDLVSDFIKQKTVTLGKYWIPGQSENFELLNFVNTWLKDWVGYVEETVFDVNMVMINDHTACVTNYNKEVFDFFKKHKIEPIIVPLRHRFFWDGGLHCVSLDLYRQGNCETFIDRL